LISYLNATKTPRSMNESGYEGVKIIFKEILNCLSYRIIYNEKETVINFRP
jgi:hypothetical protein